jgi:lysophospholipase L1-like esterase
MSEIAMIEAMKAKKLVKLLEQLVGNEAELPLAGTIVDNIKGSLSGGFTQIASSLPTTISPVITANSAIVSIKGKTNVPTTIVSKTRQELDMVNIVPTLAMVTKANYSNGFQLTGAPGADWYARYLQHRVTLKPNTQYTLSAKAITNDDDGLASGIIIYEAGNTNVTVGTHRNANNLGITFTTTATGSVDIRYYLVNASSALPSIQTSYYDIMLAESATPVPYAGYFRESHTIPATSSYSQIVNIVPGCTISNPEGLVNSFSTVQIAVASAVQAINGEAPDTNGNINIVIPKSQITGKKVVIFGDSIMEFGTVPEQVANLTGATVYDCSFGGTRMSMHPDVNYDKLCMTRIVNSINTGNFTAQDTANTNLIASVSDDNTANLNTLKGIDWSTIDYVLIAYGTNDFGGKIALGDTTTVDSFTWAIDYTIKTLLTKYPHLKIYFTTPIWRWNWGKAVNDSDVSPNDVGGVYLREYCTKIQETAKLHHVPVLDLYNSSGINLITKDYYIADGTHPTVKGYTQVAEKIAKFLTSI